MKKSELREMIKDVINENKVGKIILQQLGGNKFIAMTGAKGFGITGNTLVFKIGRNSKGVNYIRITLDSNDTYTMEFINIRKQKITIKAKHSGIYNDQLTTIFEKETGMYTHL